jgi:hypothetical protein
VFCSTVPEKRYIQVTDDQICIFSDDGPKTYGLSGITCAAYNSGFLVVGTDKNLVLFDVEAEIKEHHKWQMDGVVAVSISPSSIAAFTFAGRLIIISIMRKKIISESEHLAVIGLHYLPDESLVIVPTLNSIYVRREIETEIACEGVHTGIIPLSNGDALITGDPPYRLHNGGLTPLKSPVAISAAFFEDRLFLLGANELYCGSIGEAIPCSVNYASNCPVVGHRRFGKFYFIARLVGNSVQLFCSTSKFGTFSGEEAPFYIFDEDVVFVDFLFFEEALFAVGSTKIARFVVYETVSECTSSIALAVPCLSCGIFRDRLLYLQFSKEITYNTIDEDCNLERCFGLSHSDPILASAFFDDIVAIVGPSKLLLLYWIDEFNERFVPVATWSSFEVLTAVAIVKTYVVCGSSGGNVFIIDLVERIGGEIEPEVLNSFSIGERVTVIGVLGSRVLIGSEYGMVIELQEFDESESFRQLYQVLAKRVCSLGRFSKGLERMSKVGPFFTSKGDVCDLECLTRFREMSEEERTAILADSGFRNDEVMDLIDIL